MTSRVLFTKENGHGIVFKLPYYDPQRNN